MAATTTDFDTFTKINRDFVMVSETLWRYFHQRWREIDRTWKSGPMIVEWLDLAPAIQAERDALRAEVRGVAQDYPGPYLVPV